MQWYRGHDIIHGNTKCSGIAEHNTLSGFPLADQLLTLNHVKREFRFHAHPIYSGILFLVCIAICLF